VTGLRGHDVLNIADLRRLAERRVPRAVFDYIDGGAENEVTLQANVRAYEGVALRPRGAVATVENTALELRSASVPSPYGMTVNTF